GARAPAITWVATSRAPIGVQGEVTWRVPPLSLADEAMELFTDRARRVLPAFTITADTADTVTDICHRLGGMAVRARLCAASRRGAHRSTGRTRCSPNPNAWCFTGWRCSWAVSISTPP